MSGFRVLGAALLAGAGFACVPGNSGLQLGNACASLEACCVQAPATLASSCETVVQSDVEADCASEQTTLVSVGQCHIAGGLSGSGSGSYLGSGVGFGTGTGGDGT